MTRPIQPNQLFATPNDMESLMAWVEAHTGSERVVAATAAGMAWNLAAKLLDDQEAMAQSFNEQVQTIKRDDDGTDSWDYWSPGDL